MSRKATESLSIDEAEKQLEFSDWWVDTILKRVKPLMEKPEGCKVLEIGAAQGRGLIALRRRGYEAYGVEPWDEARNTAADLARREDVVIEMREGRAEAIPFEDASFDLVVAMSVMEHVEDLELSLSEIHRVLKPGGLFWFNSASSVSPFQGEISFFPAFGWYPDSLKRRIMRWAQEHRPSLIGHTTAPALHWWTPAKANRKLREAGFGEIWDRWDLRRAEEEVGLRRTVLQAIKGSRLLRRVADVAVGGCSYATRKP